MKLLGVLVVVLGVLALIYGGFTYVEEVHRADLGPIEIEVKDKERVNIPVWVGAGAVIVGAAMLIYEPRGKERA